MAPQTHPQAQFVPISPELDLSALVENTANFDYVTRLPREIMEQHSAQSLENLILLHVVIGGKPLVIEGWEDRIDPYKFSTEWLQGNLDKKVIKARDISNGIDVEMTMGHYLRNLSHLTNQFTKSNFRDPKRQRLYLKDMDTPDEWAKDLKAIIPETLYYLNECIESRTGGDGAILEQNEYGQMRYGNGVAPAGDLMSSLPSEMQALNMMCYIGHEGTYTPAHREMCASLGHNIMVETSEGTNGEKPGSSIWFMTETKEREVVSEYFLSMLGHDIEVEKHFAQVNAWKKAPFNVWVAEQRVGDLILIPPLAPHQVWNRGTRTMKAAWNRTTIDTLELALHEALPRARMVCRDEQYKNKAIIYYTLKKYHALLQRDTIEPKMWKYGRIKQLLEDFKRLFQLYSEVLVSEMFGAALPAENNVELLPFDSNVTCSYCRCNIFNRFLTCKSCNTGEDDTYDICMDCYAMGRSCACISNLNWVEQWEWRTLTENYETWRRTLVNCDGSFDLQKSPQPLEVARKRYGRKPVAQVCQEQLKLRPWHDPSNPEQQPPSPGMSDVEPETDDKGRPKKKQPINRSLKCIKHKTSRCHVSQKYHWNWKLAFCTTCTSAYNYGVLWRAFDIMPQEVMEDRDWSCPICQGICSCGKCRKNPAMQPYAPKGTLLGHGTRLVADFRSVESLVDFSKTNLGWLRGENDDNPRESSRMKKLKEKAEAEKAREDVIDENYRQDPDQEIAETMIDPELETPGASMAFTNDSYQTPYPLTDSNPAYRFDGGDDQPPHNWFDGHYDLELETFSRPSTDYPSKLLAPAALEQQLYINPADLTKTRMMGIGYYQQEDEDSGDKILYYPPNMDGTTEHPSKLNSSATANFELSDVPRPLVNTPKKRKHDGADKEFRISKRQKRLADAKRHLQPLEETPRKSGSISRQPRRSVGKPQTYIEVDENLIPFSEEHIVPKRKPKLDNEDDDEWALAAQAMSRLAETPSAQKNDARTSSTKRGRPTNSSTATKSPSATPAATKPRKSAWLARKNAHESDEEFSTGLPTKKERSRTSHKAALNEIVHVYSGSEDGDFDRGVTIEDDDSLFGDPDALEKSSGGADIQWRVSDHNPNVKVAESVVPTANRRGRPPKVTPGETSIRARDSESRPKSEEIQVKIHGKEISTPKRRGRPLKAHVFTTNGFGTREVLAEPSETGELVEVLDRASLQGGAGSSKGPLTDSNVVQELVSPAAVEETSPEMPTRRGRPPKAKPPVGSSAIAIQLPSAGPKRMLSLKEKLAMTGKTFKVVAAKSRRSLASAVASTNTRSTPSLAKELQAGSSLLSPAEVTDTNNFLEIKDSKSEPYPTQPAKKVPTVVRLHSPEAVQKGPTVVRLESPDEETGFEAYSSSSDESIPAVRPSPRNSKANMGLAGTFGTAKGAVNGDSQRGRGMPSIKM